MLPAFEPETGNLPPGVHEAAWEEVAKRYGYNVRRVRLLEGLKRALTLLRQAGCRVVYLNSSFVTAKVEPRDFDVCWDTDGVNVPRLARLERALLYFSKERATQKALFAGELFPSDWPADEGGTIFVDYFQRVAGSDGTKGIVMIRLSSLL